MPTQLLRCVTRFEVAKWLSVFRTLNMFLVPLSSVVATVYDFDLYIAACLATVVTDTDSYRVNLCIAYF